MNILRITYQWYKLFIHTRPKSRFIHSMNFQLINYSIFRIFVFSDMSPAGTLSSPHRRYFKYVFFKMCLEFYMYRVSLLFCNHRWALMFRLRSFSSLQKWTKAFGTRPLIAACTVVSKYIVTLIGTCDILGYALNYRTSRKTHWTIIFTSSRWVSHRVREVYREKEIGEIFVFRIVRQKVI